MTVICTHYDRPRKAKGFCGSCYNKHLDSICSDDEKQRRLERRRTYRKGKPHDPEANRCRQLKHRYGLTPEEYDAQAIKQQYRCAACSKRVNYRLYVDHDHTTNIVRQLLCAGCNTIAGALENYDCFDVFQYLKHHNSNALARLELLLREKEQGEETGPTSSV